jgi:hypothetical protein
MGGLGVPAALTGVIIVSLMIAGTIDVEIDDAWLWALLALFAVAMVAGGASRGTGRRE